MSQCTQSWESFIPHNCYCANILRNPISYTCPDALNLERVSYLIIVIVPTFQETLIATLVPMHPILREFPYLITVIVPIFQETLIATLVPMYPILRVSIPHNCYCADIPRNINSYTCSNVPNLERVSCLITVIVPTFQETVTTPFCKWENLCVSCILTMPMRIMTPLSYAYNSRNGT